MINRDLLSPIVRRQATYVEARGQIILYTFLIFHVGRWIEDRGVSGTTVPGTHLDNNTTTTTITAQPRLVTEPWGASEVAAEGSTNLVASCIHSRLISISDGDAVRSDVARCDGSDFLWLPLDTPSEQEPPSRSFTTFYVIIASMPRRGVAWDDVLGPAHSPGTVLNRIKCFFCLLATYYYEWSLLGLVVANHKPLLNSASRPSTRLRPLSNSHVPPCLLMLLRGGD